MTDRSLRVAFGAVLDCMDDAVLVLDPEGTIQYGNGAARSLVGTDPVGMSRAELIRCLGLTTPDGSPVSPDELIAPTVTTGPPAYVITAREPRVVVASAVSPFAAGDAEGTVAVWHDVTDRYDAEAESEELLARLEAAVQAQRRERGVLEALMENTPAHLAYLDRDMRFVAVNATYAAGSGHTEEELVGRDHFELFPNAENEAVFKRARDLGETVEYRAKPFEFADQPWRGVTYWDWRLTPVKDSAGEVQGLVLSLVDVTATIRAKRYSDALNRLNDVIHSTLRIDGILAEVVPELAAAIGCEMVGVFLRRESGGWWLAESQGVPEKMRGATFEDAEFPGGEVLEADRIIVAPGPEDAWVAGRPAERLGVQSMLLAPLALPDRPLGVLALAYLSGPGEFDEAKIDLIRKAGTSLALALNNARAFENEHRVARVLQESMLALPSSIEGLRFAHEYRAASESELVGGDFYDLFEIEAGLVGILIGDIAGKGLDAAVLTSVVKDTVRAHAAETGKSPARVLELTNELMYRSTPPEAFATVFFGVLHLGDGRLRYANAGHTAGALLREGGVVESLGAESPLLGAFPTVGRAESEVGVAPGDVLFLYTDGLVEARRAGAGELYGEERLFAVLRDAPRVPEHALRRVTSEVMAFTGGTLRDDVAILAVQRLPV